MKDPYETLKECAGQYHVGVRERNQPEIDRCDRKILRLEKRKQAAEARILEADTAFTFHQGPELDKKVRAVMVEVVKLGVTNFTVGRCYDELRMMANVTLPGYDKPQVAQVYLSFSTKGVTCKVWVNYREYAAIRYFATLKVQNKSLDVILRG